MFTERQLPSKSFLPKPHSLICGDFNSHHGLWYGNKVTEYCKRMQALRNLLLNDVLVGERVILETLRVRSRDLGTGDPLESS
jgi:hypothetical protein